MKHIQEIGIGNICRKCGLNISIRTKKGKIKPNSFYILWEYCKNCNAVYFNKKYKVSR